MPKETLIVQFTSFKGDELKQSNINPQIYVRTIKFVIYIQIINIG